MQSQEHGITKQHKLGKDCSHSDLIEPESTVGLKIISLCSIRKYQKKKESSDLYEQSIYYHFGWSALEKI